MNIHGKTFLEEIAESAGKHQATMPAEPSETAYNEPEAVGLKEHSSRQITAENEPKQPAVNTVVESVKNKVNHKEKPLDYYLEMVEKFTAEQ